MGKLKLIGFLMFCLFNLSSQNKLDNQFIAKSYELEWTYSCGGKLLTTADTLIVSPNPFDSIAVIEFSIANTDTIWLDIFNATGNTVKTYYNATVLSSGTYTLNFDGDTLLNGIYFVRLKINSAIQTVKLIKNVNAVGINESSILEYNFVIYPNPTTSIINISDEQKHFQNTTIDIKDYLGHVVYTSPFNSQIDLHNLSAGMYFLTMQNGHHSNTVKIIKQ